MKNENQVIVFRADGGSEIGLGHLVRSTALAHMVKDEFDCVLATRCTIDSLLETLKPSFSRIISLPDQDYNQEAQLLAETFPVQNLIVLDGYNFDSQFQERLVGKGFDLFSIDDIHAFQFHSKVIINHAGGINPLDYQSLPFTQFYLGPRYSLLREPFLEAAKHRRTSVNDNNCFVCFGGADPDNKTLDILKDENIRGLKEFRHFHVVVGNAYKWKQELENFIKGQNITLHYALSPEEMVVLMTNCSFAICSPSSIVYEYMSVGGVVFLEQIADNQKDIIKFFLNQEMAFKLDDLAAMDDSKINNALKKQAVYFDGNSGERLKKVFQQYFNSKQLFVRKVNSDDLETCFIWANDVDVRLQSYNQNQINLPEHVTWFNNLLSDPDSYFYILEIEGNPVAQIRFHVTGEEAVLSYLADKSIRFKGLGTSILSVGIEKFIQDYSQPVKIIGFVKKSNIPSQRSFEKMSFVKEECSNYEESYKYSLYYNC